MVFGISRRVASILASLVLPYLGLVLPFLKCEAFLIVPGYMLHKRRLASNEQRHCFFKMIVPGERLAS
jgi:hypothetical protein